MKKNISIFSVTSFMMLITFFITFNIGLSYSQDKPTLSAGVAKVNITPKEKIPIGWHSGENIPYDSVHDEVFSRAMVFSNRTKKAAIISVDISGIPNSAWEELTNRIEKETGISIISEVLKKLPFEYAVIGFDPLVIIRDDTFSSIKNLIAPSESCSPLRRNASS